MVAQFINDNASYNYLVAPHDVDQQTIMSLQQKLKFPQTLYSQMSSDLSQQVLIVDTLGDLKYLYRFTNLAYVGAGFEKGPHNVLESIVYGILTLCGPNIEKFPMAQKLNKNRLLTIIQRKEDFSLSIFKALDSDFEAFSKNAEIFFKENSFDLSNLIKDLSE